jgi:uncharacterized protein YcbX
MMRVESIWTYPLTGGRRQFHEGAHFGTSGIQQDRELVVYAPEEPGKDAKRVSQKRYPRMARVMARMMNMKEKAWAITFPESSGLEELLVSEREGSGRVTVDEFGDRTPCIDMGSAAGKVFSEYLDARVGLARKSPYWLGGRVRPLPKDRRVAPLHIVTSSTVERINEMLPGSDIDASRFRPNIVLTSYDEPFEEQYWVGKNLEIDEARFMVHRLTTRCLVTGIDQTSGIRRGDVPGLFPQLPHMEGGNQTIIGAYAYPLEPGSIAVRREGRIVV